MEVLEVKENRCRALPGENYARGSRLLPETSNPCKFVFDHVLPKLKKGPYLRSLGSSSIRALSFNYVAIVED